MRNLHLWLIVVVALAISMVVLGAAVGRVLLILTMAYGVFRGNVIARTAIAR
jgi:hypothetical protein